MCGARLFAVRVILLQRTKVLPACLPDFGSLPTLIQGARNGRQSRFKDFGKGGKNFQGVLGFGVVEG